MNGFKSTVIACFLAGMVQQSNAQLVLSGEFRPRTEYRHGYATLPITDGRSGFFTDQRTRLNFKYSSEGYDIFFSLQDVRTWGSQSQLSMPDGLSSIHEAWGKVKLSENFSAKIGRQELVYDDHRIFGHVGWTQQARSHDALVLRFAKKGMTADFGMAYNQNAPSGITTLYTVPSNYKSIQYLWLHNDFSENLGISFLALNNGLQPYLTDTLGNTWWKDNYTQTVGSHVSYKKDKLTINGNGYYQMGVAGNWLNSTVAAYLGGLNISYKMTDQMNTTVGFELISGTSQTDTANTESNSFNPFYGTNHKFNGHMDYFYVGNHIGNVGLQDIFVKLQYNAKDGFNAGVDVHMFSAAAEVLNLDEFMKSGSIAAMDALLGTEIDVYGGCNIAKGVALKMGYSQMFGTGTLQALKGGDYNEITNWGWVMVVMKPTFLEGK